MRAALVFIGCLAMAVPGAATAQAPAFTPLPSVTLPAELDRVLRDYERA